MTEFSTARTPSGVRGVGGTALVRGRRVPMTLPGVLGPDRVLRRGRWARGLTTRPPPTLGAPLGDWDASKLSNWDPLPHPDPDRDWD